MQEHLCDTRFIIWWLYTVLCFIATPLNNNLTIINNNNNIDLMIWTLSCWYSFAEAFCQRAISKWFKYSIALLSYHYVNSRTPIYAIEKYTIVLPQRSIKNDCILHLKCRIYQHSLSQSDSALWPIPCDNSHFVIVNNINVHKL